MDTWLVWNLTNGAVHVTDPSNASRTMLFDINRCAWDETLLAELAIPREMLPTVRPTSEVYGQTGPAFPSGPGSRSPLSSETSRARSSARPVSSQEP